MHVQRHNQVKLARGNERDTRWIPSEFATQGRDIKIKQNGEWQEGWKVLEVFEPAVDYDYLQEQARNYKTHRKATDV